MRSLWFAAASAALLSATAFVTVARAAGDADDFRYLTRQEAFALVAKPNPNGRPVSSYLSRHDDFSQALVRRTRSGNVEIHDLYTDYMVMLDGQATLTIGGTLKNRHANPNGSKGEWLGDSSSGGKVYKLEPGVMVTVPKGTPHWIQLPENGTLRYIFFKRRG